MLGINAVHGPKSHADIIASYAERLAVLEVKGKTNSASRANAQQCTTWVSELRAAIVSEPEQRDPVTQAYLQCVEKLGFQLGDFHRSDAEPPQVKGILLINSYRDTPLDQRTQPSFPHAMHRTIVDGKLCALTTLQLLGMVLRARENASELAHLLETLFETVGVTEESTEWEAFLCHAPTQSSSA